MIRNPILLDLPMPIRTQRLLIRPMMPGDGKHVFDLIEESRTLFQEWFSWEKNVHTWHDSEKTAREFYAGFITRTAFNFLIFNQNYLVGSCSFNDPDWEIPSAAVGYLARQSEQGNGYIREAVKALILYAFHHIGFKRLEILCDDANTKSAAIPEALGFSLETKAFGLVAKPGTQDLRLCRRYVRFDTKGLEWAEETW